MAATSISSPPAAPSLHKMSMLDERCMKRVTAGATVGAAVGGAVGALGPPSCTHTLLPGHLRVPAGSTPDSAAGCTPVRPPGAVYGTYEAFRYKARASDAPAPRLFS